jgi:hypothetical protein
MQLDAPYTLVISKFLCVLVLGCSGAGGGEFDEEGALARQAAPLQEVAGAPAPPRSNDRYFISSQATNQLMIYSTTGTFGGVVRAVLKPAASQIGYGGDLFLAAAGSGDVLRFDGFTGAYKGIFIPAGTGGLTTPSAPGIGPDGLFYVGDTTLNRELRFDPDGNYIDVLADHATSGLTEPLMQVFDDTSMFICSKQTDSILRYELRTNRFMGEFVPPGGGGLSKPVGLAIGPDNRLYAGSSGTNAVLRYDLKTGEFIDAFVPPGTAGLSDPRAVRFGGPNTNLYVVSSGNNRVLEFDRQSGAFVRVVADGTADGLAGSRGLTFTPRPEFRIDSVRVEPAPHSTFAHAIMDYRLLDYSDPHPRVQLRSVVSSDPDLDLRCAVRGARWGHEDWELDLDLCNDSGSEQHYTITYEASNDHRLTSIATAEVTVPPSDRVCGSRRGRCRR